MRADLIAVCATVLMAFGAAANADPCKAIPDNGPAPAWLRPGITFAGPVPYVGDGDSLCVDVGLAMGKGYSADGQMWVEVRLADFYAPELHNADGPAAKAVLERIVRGKIVECHAEHQSYDRMVSFCRISGISLGDRMRAAGVREGGRGR